MGDCVGDDRERLLFLELAEFDQDMKGGGRRSKQTGAAPHPEQRFGGAGAPAEGQGEVL